MGSCLTRLEAEMVAPPPRRGNWEGLSPQRPEALVCKGPQGNRTVQRQQTALMSCGNGVPLDRKETESGIPGLTYDHAGRPVWREENSAQVEHRENKW